MRAPRVAPISLVISFIGMVLLLTVLGIIGLAAFRVDIPDVLGTVCVASMTGLAGLLTPNTGLMTLGAKSATRAAAAAETASQLVQQAEASEALADQLETHRQTRDGGRHA